MTSEDEVRTHFKYTVSPSAQTLVRLKTLPDAVCRVRFDADDASPFTVISSSAGYIDLYATCAEGTESQRIIVEATNTATAVEQAIDLRCATRPTRDAPNHIPDPWPSSPLDRILPALSDEEAANEDATQLAARGYPKRPNPDTAPANYKDWRRLVSRPLTVVAPSLIANPDYIRQPGIAAGHRQSDIVTPADVTTQQTYNWAGGELHYNEGDTFVLVEGWWVTPSVSLNNMPAGAGITSVWVGLNRPNALQLLQCGVDHNAIAYPINNLVTSYQAWSQMLPAQQFAVNINNLPIAPGDQIMCTSAVVDNNNAPSPRATQNAESRRERHQADDRCGNTAARPRDIKRCSESGVDRRAPHLAGWLLPVAGAIPRNQVHERRRRPGEPIAAHDAVLHTQFARHDSTMGPHVQRGTEVVGHGDRTWKQRPVRGRHDLVRPFLDSTGRAKRGPV
jgi:hypothetical protein